MVNQSPRNKLQWNSNQNREILIGQNAFEKVICCFKKQILMNLSQPAADWWNTNFVEILGTGIGLWNWRDFPVRVPWVFVYPQTFNIRCTLVGNTIIDHSDIVGALPVGTTTTISFSTKYLASMDWAETNARHDEKIYVLGLVWLILEVWQYMYMFIFTFIPLPSKKLSFHSISWLKS